ncbi:uncharacterized protein METZ01_LOCUS406176 [marine metagenome]|uniref:Uncharacterized protein n=1 Tax=marine metagenome TaxID=408172 RepID=A0A382W3D3_9ZZZZ
MTESELFTLVLVKWEKYGQVEALTILLVQE